MFTFNFKTLSIVCSILLSAVLVISTEIGFRNYFKDENPYKVRDEINQKKPDIILLGNSMIGENINQQVLESELSRLTNRPIHSKFIIFPGAHGALFYVVFKEQILTSNAAGIPIGIVTHGPHMFLSTGRGGNEHDAIKNNLIENDPVFFKKYKNKTFKFMYQMKDYSKAVYYSPGSSTRMLLEAIGYLYFKDHSSKKVSNVLRRRIKKLNSGSSNNFSELSLQPEGAEELPPIFTFKNRYNNHRRPFTFTDLPDDEKNTAQIQKSFIPDILSESKRFHIFFIDSRPSPNFLKRTTRPDNPGLKNSFIHYIRSHDAHIIDTLEFQELNNQLYFEDNTHLNKTGELVNTRLLAKKIYDEGLIH